MLLTRMPEPWIIQVSDRPRHAFTKQTFTEKTPRDTTCQRNCNCTLQAQLSLRTWWVQVEYAHIKCSKLSTVDQSNPPDSLSRRRTHRWSGQVLPSIRMESRRSRKSRLNHSTNASRQTGTIAPQVPKHVLIFEI